MYHQKQNKVVCTCLYQKVEHVCEKSSFSHTLTFYFYVYELVDAKMTGEMNSAAYSIISNMIHAFLRSWLILYQSWRRPFVKLIDTVCCIVSFSYFHYLFLSACRYPSAILQLPTPGQDEVRTCVQNAEGKAYAQVGINAAHRSR